MKKFFCVLFGALMAAMLFGLAACASSAPLENWTDREEEIAFGSDYVLMTTVSDADGNTYGVSAVVSINGEPLTVEGNAFTVVEKGEYKIVYTAEKHKDPMTVTLKVIDRTPPVIVIGEKVTFVPAGERYYLPEVSVHEEFDEEAPACTVTVTKEDGTALQKLSDDRGEYVVPDTEGNYEFRAVSKDASGNERTESFTFKAVGVQEDEWNFLSDEDVALATRTYSESYAKNYTWYANVLGEEGVISYDLSGGIESEFPLDYFGVMPVVKDISRYENKDWLVLRMYFEGSEGSVKNFWYGHSNIGRLAFPQIVYNEWEDYYLRITDEFLASFSDFASGTNYSRFHGDLTENVKVYLDGIRLTNEGPQDMTPVREDEVVFVNNQLSANYLYNTNAAIQSAFVSAAELETLGFSGDYAGNAIRFVASDNAHTNSEYMLLPRIGEAAYQAASEKGYTHLYVWVCVSADDGAALFGGLFRADAESWGIPAADMWVKVSVALTDEVKTKLFASGGTQLFRVWAEKQTGKQEIYVGDIGFEKQISLADEGYAVRVEGAQSLANIYNPDGIPNAYVSAEEMESLGFSGDYAGNAVKFTAGDNAHLNGSYTLKPAITQEEYEAAVEKMGYTHLYVWVCVSADDGAALFGGLFRADAESWGIPAADMWVKVSVALTDEVKTKLFASGGTQLFRVWAEKQTGKQEIYVGDIGFEKVV